MNDRTIKLLGKTIFERIRNASILLIGLGGVGGYTLEALVRSGFQNITIVDFDCFDITNLNRQILATTQSIGKSKCETAYERCKLINPNVSIKIIEKKLTENDITENFIIDYDFIVDACDSVLVKVELIKKCSFLNQKMISCMGTANRVNPELLKIIKLEHTKNDPLARKIRTLLKDNKRALKTYVLCSEEVPIKQKELGTICSVPMASGASLVSFIIRELKKEEG